MTKVFAFCTVFYLLAFLRKDNKNLPTFVRYIKFQILIKFQKTSPRRVITGKPQEIHFFILFKKMGFTCMFTRKMNQGQPFFQNHFGYTYYQEMEHKTYKYTSFKGPKTSKSDVELLVKSNKQELSKSPSGIFCKKKINSISNGNLFSPLNFILND